MRRQVSIEDKPSGSHNPWNKRPEDRRERSGLYDSNENNHSSVSSTYNCALNWLSAPSLLMQPRLKLAHVSLSHLASPNEPVRLSYRKAEPLANSDGFGFLCGLWRLLVIGIRWFYSCNLYMAGILLLPGTYQESHECQRFSSQL